MNEEKQKPMGLRFLVIVATTYIIVMMIQTPLAQNAFNISLNLLSKILPVLALVFVFMIILNLFLSPELIIRYVGKSSGAKRWVTAICAGIISTGPIYLWFALLKDLMQKGMSEGVAAAFLYARAIKPFIIPLMIYYFGLKYTIILTIVMIFASIVQGLLIEKFNKTQIMDK